MRITNAAEYETALSAVEASLPAILGALEAPEARRAIYSLSTRLAAVSPGAQGRLTPAPVVVATRAALGRIASVKESLQAGWDMVKTKRDFSWPALPR